MLQTLRDHRHKHRLLHPAKLSITIDKESKMFYLKNTYPQIQPYRKYEKETFNPRKLAVPMRTQAIDNLIPTNSKEEKHTNTTTEK